MQARSVRRLAVALIGCAGFCLQAATAFAQADPTVRKLPVRTSRVEVYGAYSYFHPYEADINKFYAQPKNLGVLAGANVYFNRFLGIEAEGTLSPTSSNDCVATLQAGPVLRLPMRRAIPFLHATGGGAKLGGPVFQPCTWGWGLTGGLGFDYVLPGFQERLAIRPVQADYEFNHVLYGPLVLPGGFDGGLMKENAFRLSAGLVLRFGNLTPPPSLGMSCSVTPGDVFAGEPITGRAEFLNSDPHKKTTYTWHTNGGTLTGSGDTVQIDTAGLPPGNYVLNGRTSQGRLAEQQAECNAHFAIKAATMPPTLTCSANPSSVKAGENVIITATAASGSGRALTYSYTTDSGTITGNGPTATLVTSGTPDTTVTVQCNVVDEEGKSATASTTVKILPVVLAPAPSTKPLCTIAFDRDKKHPARVDNEAKGCLDDIALTLQRQGDAALVIVGSRDEAESPDISAQRAMNTKLYLMREKGIDASRLQLRSGDTSGHRVYNTLVPAGAVFAQAGTLAVDEGSVKPSGPAYGVSRLRLFHKKKR